MIKLTKAGPTAIQIIASGLGIPSGWNMPDVIHGATEERLGGPVVHVDVITPAGLTFGETANLEDGGFERVLEIGPEATATGKWRVLVEPFHEHTALEGFEFQGALSD